MVFVIPEDRANPANQAAQNLANLYSQYQGSQELQKALGVDSGIDFTKLSPQQQQQVIAQQQQQQILAQQQQQAEAKAKSEQDLMDLILGGVQAPQQQQAPQVQQQNLPFQQGQGSIVPQQTTLEQNLPFGVTPIAPQQSQIPVESPLENPGFSSQSTADAVARNNARGQGRPSLTDRQVAGISIKHPQVAKILDSQNRADDARFKAVADRNWDVAKKVFENSDKQAEGLITKENALAIQREAIANRGAAGFTQDLLADATGIESLRTAEGAAFTTAGKEALLANISRAGARPNQWIEQQISDSLGKLGRTDKANNMVFEVQELDHRIQRREIELIDEIADKHEREFGYVKRSLSSDVQKELKKYADEELKITEKRMRELDKSDEVPKREVSPSIPDGRTMVETPDGRKFSIPNDQVEAFEATKAQFLQGAR
ncbi:hypothetical protein OAF54_02080 [bacterium]|nr:hypothetical protein [bacterium]